jgi:hypothetical protein
MAESIRGHGHALLSVALRNGETARCWFSGRGQPVACEVAGEEFVSGDPVGRYPPFATGPGELSVMLSLTKIDLWPRIAPVLLIILLAEFETIILLSRKRPASVVWALLMVHNEESS